MVKFNIFLKILNLIGNIVDIEALYGLFLAFLIFLNIVIDF